MGSDPQSHLMAMDGIAHRECREREASLRALIDKLEAQVAELHQRAESLNAVLQSAADEWERTASLAEEWDMIAEMRKAGR